MMRISEISRSESVVRLRVEGRLTTLAAPELCGAVESCRSDRTTVLLDLANVTFADASGVDALLALRAKGVVMLASSEFLSEMMRTGDRLAEPLGEVEGETIERLRGGDEAAFADLVARNAGRMLATAKRLLRDETEAQDAVQDAFLSAFKAMASFNGNAKLSTWLHRIVVNAALMRLRSRKHRPEQTIDALLPRFDSDGNWTEAPSEWTDSSSDLLEQRDLRVLVRRCIDQLPEAYRTILLLRDIEDLDTGETAEHLNISPNAVKIRLHRARQAVRTLLEREMAAQQAA